MLRAFALALAVITPVAATAQSLPQSTVDRQAIATLQWRLQQPGLTEIDRLQIERQITELRYRIATRPAIAPMPTLAPFSSQPTTYAPSASAPLPSSVMTQPGSHCETLRIVIAYLTTLRTDPSVSGAERSYTEQRIALLRREEQAWRCPSSARS